MMTTTAILRNTYLGHLTDVVMVSTESLAVERLGGADYDGDMIKTIFDPILNACVRKNYQYKECGMLSNAVNLPFLKILALSPTTEIPMTGRPV